MIAADLVPLAFAVDKLLLLPGNPRRGDVEAVKRSLEAFGQRKPIVARRSDSVVIAGNHTLQAAQALGWSEIAVVWVDDDDTTSKAFALADNRTAELGDYDDAALAELIGQVGSVDPDLLIASGWNAQAVQELIARIEPIKELINPELTDLTPPKIPKSTFGDVWLLGKHRVLCGDATIRKSFEVLMAGKRATMIFTDPPWNVAIGLDSNPRHRQREGLKNDNLTSEQFGSFLKSFATHAIDFLDGDIYCVLGASEWPNLDDALRSVGFHWSATVIWVKDLFVLGRSKFHRRYEPIWYGWAKNKKSSFQGARNLDDVWEIARPRRSEEHPTMKPIDLMKYAIEASSAPNQIVLEPFGGSGSTLLAAEATGRICYSIELEPIFVDVICRRFQQMTGIKPVNELTGREHDFLDG